jgi:hypothetical protein
MEVIYHDSERLADGQNSAVASDRKRFSVSRSAEDGILEFFTFNSGVNLAFCRCLFAYRAAYLKSAQDGRVYLIACSAEWDDETNIPPLDPTCYQLRHGTLDQEPTETEVGIWIEQCFSNPKVKLAILSKTTGQIITALLRNGPNLITIASVATN